MYCFYRSECSNWKIWQNLTFVHQILLLLLFLLQIFNFLKSLYFSKFTLDHRSNCSRTWLRCSGAHISIIEPYYLVVEILGQLWRSIFQLISSARLLKVEKSRCKFSIFSKPKEVSKRKLSQMKALSHMKHWYQLLDDWLGQFFDMQEIVY